MYDIVFMPGQNLVNSVRGSRITYVEKVPADVFYGANAVDQILPGHEYNIVHNRYGRPVDVQLVK